ncbi:MAG: beta-ketoacyl-[acyl-carrier-protein] synthase family protein [Myxococcaceae bacterium]
MSAAITSVGAVSGHGVGAARLAAALLDGRSAVRKLTRFEAPGLCSDLAAEAPPDEELSAAAAPLKAPAPPDRATRLLLAAAAEALLGRDLTPSDRRAVLVGTTKGALEHSVAAWRSGRAAPPDVVEHPALSLARAVGARGPVRSIGAACASSTAALGEALALIEDGVCDEVIVGGTEALHPFVYAGFHSLKALSPLPAAPFDAKRSGLSLGEGAAVLVVESAEAARRAGRKAVVTLLGFGAGADGHDQTAPDPTGAGLVYACRQALARAGVSPREVGRYHAHGTATLQNDRMEAAACAEVFGPHAVPLCAVKGSLGHTLGAAGALDAVSCALTLAQGILPAVTNLVQVDPALPIDAVLGASRRSDSPIALLATAGFGGINAALVLCRGEKP